MNKSTTIYKARIDKVINYINHHLDEPILLEDLAKVAYFSPYHFHRIFMAVTGETVNFFTNRLRMEKAARLLRFSSQSIGAIAYECGFSSPSTFARSFKQYFGTTAGNFKKAGKTENSKICKELYPINQHLVPLSEEALKQHFPVEVKRFPQRKVAFIRVVDSYREGVVLKTFERLVKWAKQKGIFDTETIFGMSLDDPMITPKEKYRYEVCITIPDSMEVERPSEISIMTLPLCKYGVVRVSGNIDWVTTAIHYLFHHWLINSPYEPEHLHAIEIFTNKDKVCDWSSFDLEICIPIKNLSV